MSDHVHEARDGRSFCECGKLLDREAIESVRLRPQQQGAKVTVDHHDYGTVEVTEHWDDKVDVKAKPDTIRLEGPPGETPRLVS